MPSPDLVIFDCDGVLVDTEPTSNAVLAENLTRHGLPLSAAECTAIFTGWSMVDVEAEQKGSAQSCQRTGSGPSMQRNSPR